MATYRRNGTPCDMPYLNRSTVALKGEHSRGKDKADRREIYDEAKFKSKEPGEVLCTITARDLAPDEVDTYQIVYGEYGDFDNKKIAHSRFNR